MNNTDQQFMKEVIKRFDDIDEKIDYLYRDFELSVKCMEERNEALEELLKVIKNV